MDIIRQLNEACRDHGAAYVQLENGDFIFPDGARARADNNVLYLREPPQDKYKQLLTRLEYMDTKIGNATRAFDNEKSSAIEMAKASAGWNVPKDVHSFSQACPPPTGIVEQLTERRERIIALQKDRDGIRQLIDQSPEGKRIREYNASQAKAQEERQRLQATIAGITIPNANGQYSTVEEWDNHEWAKKFNQQQQQWLAGIEKRNQPVPLSGTVQGAK